MKTMLIPLDEFKKQNGEPEVGKVIRVKGSGKHQVDVMIKAIGSKFIKIQKVKVIK